MPQPRWFACITIISTKTVWQVHEFQTDVELFFGFITGRTVSVFHYTEIDTWH